VVESGHRTARTLTRILGVGYLVAAVFNAFYTLSVADTAYWPDGFGETTWLAPYAWLLEHVIQPNGVLFTIGLVVFEVILGLHLLARGRRAEDGLLVATVFVLLLIPALGFPNWLVNVGLAALQLWLWSVLRHERLGRVRAAGLPRIGSAPR